jgi:D-amino peptidase
MNLFISADIEGVTGVTHWDETEPDKADYRAFRDQMTAEVRAACDGALEGGADEILVKDAHGSARNMDHRQLPEPVRLVRGWTGHPMAMLQGLDESFDGVMMIGYHSRAGSDGNPLAHTMSGRVASVRINDDYASEALMHALLATSMGVPVLLVTGDQALCDEISGFDPALSTVAVKQGMGTGTQSLHPAVALQQIRETARAAVKSAASHEIPALADRFEVEVRWTQHIYARKASFYPGVTTVDGYTIRFETRDYFEVMRTFAFIL